MNTTRKCQVMICGLFVLLGVQWWANESALSAIRARLGQTQGLLKQCKMRAEAVKRTLNQKIARLENEVEEVAGMSVERPDVVDSAMSVEHSPVDAGSALAQSVGQGDHESDQPLALQNDQKYQDSVEYLMEARIGAIGRIVNLTGQQEERLRSKFTAERSAALSGRSAETESLQSILGEEYFRFYEQQKALAFEKNKQEEVRKQVLFLSDMLRFSPDQQITLENMFLQIEDEIDQRQLQRGTSIQELVSNSRIRQARRLERISRILSAQQLKTYADYAANSPDSDMVMWHSPSEAEEEAE